jgi:hypothetical protein
MPDFAYLSTCTPEALRAARLETLQLLTNGTAMEKHARERGEKLYRAIEAEMFHRYRKGTMK